VIIRSLKCRGEGNANEVPGMGKDGERKGWGCDGNIGEPWVFTSESVEEGAQCHVGPSLWIPGRSRILSVCSTIAFRCPSK
jgi:hypothetical protein